MAVIHDFHQVITLGGVQGFQAPVINDEQLHLGQELELFVVTAVSLGLSQLQKQSREG